MRLRGDFGGTDTLRNLSALPVPLSGGGYRVLLPFHVFPVSTGMLISIRAYIAYDTFIPHHSQFSFAVAPVPGRALKLQFDFRFCRMRPTQPVNRRLQLPPLNRPLTSAPTLSGNGAPRTGGTDARLNHAENDQKE